MAAARAVFSCQWFPALVTQARAALCAAIMLALTRAEWVGGQVVMWRYVTDFRAVYVVQLIVNAMFLVPLPVLLFLLYRCRVSLVLTPALRLTALATAFAIGVVFTVPPLYGIAAAVVRDLSNTHWFGTTPAAPTIWAWLTSNSARNVFRGCVVQLAQVTLTVFLVSLLRNESDHSEASGYDYQLLRRVAAIATATAAVAVVINIVGQVRALQDFSAQQEQMRWWGGPTRLQFIVRNAFFGGMEVCRFLIPLVVYRSLSISARRRIVGPANCDTGQ
jgi:hypothetical protein